MALLCRYFPAFFICPLSYSRAIPTRTRTSPTTTRRRARSPRPTASWSGPVRSWFLPAVARAKFIHTIVFLGTGDLSWQVYLILLLHLYSRFIVASASFSFQPSLAAYLFSLLFLLSLGCACLFFSPNLTHLLAPHLSSSSFHHLAIPPGAVPTPAFAEFRFERCRSEAMARKYLADRRVPQVNSRNAHIDFPFVKQPINGHAFRNKKKKRFSCTHIRVEYNNSRRVDCVFERRNQMRNQQSQNLLFPVSCVTCHLLHPPTPSPVNHPPVPFSPPVLGHGARRRRRRRRQRRRQRQFGGGGGGGRGRGGTAAAAAAAADCGSHSQDRDQDRDVMRVPRVRQTVAYCQ
jgi:hypothetical protein